MNLTSIWNFHQITTLQWIMNNVQIYIQDMMWLLHSSKWLIYIIQDFTDSKTPKQIIEYSFKEWAKDSLRTLVTISSFKYGKCTNRILIGVKFFKHYCLRYSILSISIQKNLILLSITDPIIMSYIEIRIMLWHMAQCLISADKLNPQVLLYIRGKHFSSSYLLSLPSFLLLN